jgi:hypothetical protein
MPHHQCVPDGVAQLGEEERLAAAAATMARSQLALRQALAMVSVDYVPAAALESQLCDAERRRDEARETARRLLVDACACCPSRFECVAPLR